MSAYDLLSELRQAGVVVKASGNDRLVVDAPKGALTPDLRAALAAHKKELLAILTVTDQRPALEVELPERAVVAKVPAIVRHDTAATPISMPNSTPTSLSSPVPEPRPRPVERPLQTPVERLAQSSVHNPAQSPVQSPAQSPIESSAETIEERIRNLEQEAARLRAEQEARRAETEIRHRVVNEIKRLEEEAARLPHQEEARRAEREAIRLTEQERWRAAAAVHKKAAEEAELRRAEEERRAMQLEARRHAEEEIARRRAEEEIRKVEDQLASLRAEEVNRRAEVSARWQAEDDRWRAETENRRSADEQVALDYAAAERERLEAEARYKVEDEASRSRAETSLRTIREEIARLRAEQESHSATETVSRAADEANRKAAAEARQRAEEEARLRAEEETRLRKAEEQRQQAEHEARLRAEEEARQRAEEEARQRAEEEAHLRAEEDARLAESEARLRALEEERRHLEEQARTQAEAEARSVQPEWFPVNLDERDDSRRAESSANPLLLPEVEGMTAESEGSFIEYQEFEPRGLQLHSSAIAQETQNTDSDFQFLEESLESGQAGDSAPVVPNATLGMLASENVSERCAAVAALPNLGGEDAFTHISAAFDDPAEEVRTAAARALFNFQADRAAAFTRALREAPADRRRKIGAAIASSGLASEAIGNLTGESREKTYDAFSLLFLMSKAGEVHPLLRAIEEHANLEVRLAVVKLLALSGQHEILPAFRRLAVRGSLPPEVRSSVMEAIYQISSQVSADTPSAA